MSKSLSDLIKKNDRIFFTKDDDAVELPNLVDHQNRSFQWFVEEGLGELLSEISPIDDYTGTKLSLRFKDYRFETPKMTEAEARENNVSYDAPLKAVVELTNKVTGEVKEQEIYLGDYPWMTTRGTFVINGAERVVVSQLIRSAGVFFTSELSGTKNVYGAKVIPGRGAWLEFETAANGALYVKIDRKRKIPVTTLLKALGLSEAQMRETFAHVDQGKLSHITATLDKDPARGTNDALIEVYRRLRPGDLATVDNARSLLENMFYNFKRFDFSRVGRYKINKRLNIDIPNTTENRIMRLEDLTAIIAELIRLNNTQEPADDIDSLANRRVKLVGELVQRQFRIGLLRMERNTKDRMSMSEIETVTPGQLINARPIVAAVREFFASSQLSQFMDQINPLSELAHKRRLSSMGPGGLSRERAGFEVRDAHATHYGRICAVETPEGANIGLVLNLASYARINDYGLIETPYRKVINAVTAKDAAGHVASVNLEDEKGKVIVKAGAAITTADAKKLATIKNQVTWPVRAKVTEEVMYLDAAAEESAIIANSTEAVDEQGYFVNDRVGARNRLKTGEVDANEVTHMDASRKQIIGSSAGLIPFIEKNYVYRSLMGSNQQRQAVPLIKPQAPIVGTGLEGAVARNSGQMILAEDAGEVTKATADEVVVKYKGGSVKYEPLHYVRSNEGTSINQKVVVSTGQKVKKGDVLVEGMSISGGELALGKDLFVAFMPWRGYNFEDAIVVSRRLVEDDTLTSVHIVDYMTEVRETKLGPEIVTRDIPNVSEDALRHLDEDGIVRIGAEVHPGDILVGKITPKGEQELSSEERLLRAIFGEKAKEVRDTSQRMSNGKHGKVVGVKIFSRANGHELKAGVIMQIQVFVAQMRKISVGDKLGGRHGNKGVIARVMPIEDMPFTEDGTPIDIVLNPLGVPSRMNVGQLFETHLGMAARALGITVASPSFNGVKISKIEELLKEAGLPEDGKQQLYDGRTGEAFTERTTVGSMYMIKLNHMVTDKIHARSTGPYTMVTQQPLGGKAQNGGQRFGEMEVWALEAYGASNSLQEMLTIKSDDVYGRSKAYESIIKKTQIVGPKVPESFNVLVKELQGLGLKVDLVTSDIVIDAEEILADNIKDEADHLADVEVPAAEINPLDITEEAVADEFEMIELDDQLHENNVTTATALADDTNDDNDGDAVVAIEDEEEKGGSVMRRYSSGTDIADFDAVRLAVASSGDILDWSHGEVTKPETINYRTQKPERDGLFCERIFGPVKDINPHDAKYKGVRSREAAVDKNGELVTKSIVRRERMGHISLASPVAHIWFLRGTPSAMGLVLGATVKSLERVVYFASYIIKKVDEAKRDQYAADKAAEFDAAKEAIKLRYEAQAKEDGADVKVLAEAQNKELDELTADYEVTKAQLDSLNKMALISENDYRALPDEFQDIIEVGMGGAALRDLLSEVNLVELIKTLDEEAQDAKGQRKKKLMKRLRLLESMDRAGIKPTSLCLSVLPVIPPDLRPMVQLTGGRFATSDLNDLYRRVINRNNRLKKLIDLNAPEVICRNEQRMLQEAVDALIDNSNARSGRAVAATGQRRRLKSLSDMLKGKQGRFRQNLLGKRVDYSGRSVIVAGPELKISQCGLPKMMALELFKPFVIGELIENEHAHNIRSATRMIEAGETPVWDALDKVIHGKYVLLNRAPSLHRLSIQAFQPILIEGKAIQLHPLVCKGFNADFDGDQMAVHLPLSDAAQAEARDIMASNKNLLKPADGSPILHIEQDIVLGCYYLTYDRAIEQVAARGYANIDEALMALDGGSLTLQGRVRIPVRGEIRETTLGRVLFNEIFPDDFPYQDEPMTKKKLAAVMSLVYEQYGQDTTARIADDLKDIGFKYATMSGLSMGMGDFTDVEGLDKIIAEGEEKSAKISEQYDQGFITEDERYRLTVETWMDTDSRVLAKLSEQFATEDTAMAIAAISGARGNVGQVKNTVGMLGVTTDATGRAIELPIRSNYKYGFSPLEYFTATRGARKGMIDTALKTADSGYLTRRLVDVAQDVFTLEEECDDPGFAIYRSDAKEIGVPYASRLEGRYASEKIGKIVGKEELISREAAAAIEADESIDGVRIMSVLSCSNVRGVSRKSYGLDPATGELVADRHPIGVIAAQSIGEPGTQLTLRTFHSGGSAAADDITQGLPRVEEIFEVRSPKGQAFLSELAGTVRLWEDGNQYVVEVTANNMDKVELSLKNRTADVEDGIEVAVGDVVATGQNASNPLVAPVAGKIAIRKDKVVITPTDQPTSRYEIPGFKQLLVKDGDEVVAGQRMTNGSINLHELMRLQGVEVTQRYIMNEILRIFASQGQNIADKHLEIIVRQMFGRVQIEDSGDSEFVTGDIVSKIAVLEENERLVAAKKEPAKFSQLLLGITKSSLSTESFLSAASFQDTTRVLIAAATSGKVDHLYGLKENVILGRRIPVGTGYRTEAQLEEEAELAKKRRDALSEHCKEDNTLLRYPSQTK